MFREDFFNYIASELLEKNIVKDSYLNAIKQRESEFPTGLATKVGINVAIPHTDTEHANEDLVVFSRVGKSLRFSLMEDPEESIETRLIFNIIVKNPSNQIKFLTKLMGLFQQEELLKYLLEEKNKKNITIKLNNFINN